MRPGSRKRRRQKDAADPPRERAECLLVIDSPRRRAVLCRESRSFTRRSGKEFILGRIIVPASTLYEHYLLQGRRSYSLASQFTDRDLFLELSTNFLHYRNVLELVRIYLETAKNRDYLKARRIITDKE